METVRARIHERSEIAEDTLEVVFTLEEPISFTAGQYVTVTVPELMYEDISGNSRDFAIVSFPGSVRSIAIAFRQTGSGFKRTISELPIDSPVTIGGPKGTFILPDANEKPVVLIAGGIGIAPFVSMIRHHNEQKQQTDLVLLYANHSPARSAYREELARLEREDPHLTKHDLFGDIDTVFIHSNVPEPQNALWYISGPPGMVEVSRILLQELGVVEADIHTQIMTGYSTVIHPGSFLYTAPNRLHTGTPEKSVTGNIIAKSLLDVLDKTALLVTTDVDGVITYVNKEFCLVSKYAPDELIGHNHRILDSSYHDRSFFKDLWTTIKSGSVWRGEIRNRDKSGAFYWVDTSIAPIFDSEGSETGFIAVSFPITDRKSVEEREVRKSKELEAAVKTMEAKNQELINTRKATLNILEDLDLEKKEVEEKIEERTHELSAEKEKLNIVTERMISGAILLDTIGDVIYANQTLLGFIGRTTFDPATLMEQFFKVFSEPEVRACVERCLHEQTSGTIPEVDIGGRIYTLQVKNIAHSAESDDVLAETVIFVRDITEEKIFERSKSELVAVASHQLRTPLTAMRGNVEMLVDESFGTLNSEQKEILSDIETSTIRLIEMVNDMLDITKIESKTLELDLTDVALPEVIDSIVADLSEYAERHGFTITHERPTDDMTAKADAVRIRQVLQNLIDNAIKYCKPKGTLTISYASDGPMIEMTFSDDGIGIPKVEQSKLFGRFYRASNTAKTTSSGSGLGLYIVKSIVESHGGTITFVSEENKGTTFTLRMPRAPGLKTAQADVPVTHHTP